MTNGNKPNINMHGLSYLIELIYKSIIGKSFTTVLDPNLKENQGKNLK